MARVAGAPAWMARTVVLGPSLPSEAMAYAESYHAPSGRRQAARLTPGRSA